MEGGERRAGTVIARLLIAHLVAYPIAAAWIVGAMPFCFPIFERAITEATGDVVVWGVLPIAAGPAIVVRATLVIGAIVFALEHVVGVAWALGKEPRRARRRFSIASLVLGGVGVALAVSGWLWFLIRYGA
jgi:hypothetical protein